MKVCCQKLIFKCENNGESILKLFNKNLILSAHDVSSGD